MAIEGFQVETYENIASELVKYRDNFNSKGLYLGFPNLNNHYNMMLGTCTDWTGFPMSGKTQVLMEMLMNTSLFYHWKHLVYFPDVGSSIEIIADLIHKKTSKSFDPTKTNVITDEEIRRAGMWVTLFFKILTKKDVKAKMTPVQFWDYAVELKKSEGLHTASIDSWKDLNHPYNDFGGYATYLEFVLPYRNMIAEENDLHLHTIIHPKLTEKENGKRNPPSPYDLKGGSEWFNSGKCMITVHRPDVMNNVAEIYVNKVKPRACGKLGMTNLMFDTNTLTYYNLDETNPNNKIYAKKLDEPINSVLKPKFDSKMIEDFNNQKTELPF